MRKKTKMKDTCELCGYQSDLGAIEKRYIVPTELTEHAGISRSQIIILCHNCSYELDTWYASKIASTKYNYQTKLFSPKSPPDVVKEYRSVFKGFAKYKKEKAK